MANYQYPYSPQLGQMSNQFNQFQQIQSMFPQPQGSVYSINGPLDIGSVPISSTGLSVALCFQESLMYIKSFQNGNPVIMAYRITPYTKDDSAQTQAPAAEEVNPLEQRLAKLEQILLTNNTNEGGKFNGLL